MGREARREFSQYRYLHHFSDVQYILYKQGISDDRWTGLENSAQM
jgi:hypothetical protein